MYPLHTFRSETRASSGDVEDGGGLTFSSKSHQPRIWGRCIPCSTPSRATIFTRDPNLFSGCFVTTSHTRVSIFTSAFRVRIPDEVSGKTEDESAFQALTVMDQWLGLVG
ncbi:jg26255 [Pararge aegeria aegeria]|uniref:Jg26255 protein n=1 Tax=Pararge aegeria aegeria TaxID=348720 RepID=A0A8S4QST5_9NEOP|nr:jg26255 [Pararge aegeria aegeria]